MDLLSVILIAIGLSMDAFAVSICKGLAMKKPTAKAILTIGLWFGVFQAVMPIVGYFIGASLYQFISEFDHWVVFIILALIGLNMIREAFEDEDENVDDSIGMGVMLILAIATSIDALAVGISFAMDSTDVFIPAVIIGIITMAISMAGVKAGSLVGDRYSKKAEIAGGIILILIGLKVLLEHLGVL